MARQRTPGLLLRGHGGGHAPVSYLELFLDLVYVFAITQISHFLIAHMSATGLIEGALIFAAVWWAWMYTTWAANWADPAKVQVRIVLLLVMFASLVMAVTIPRAFTSQGLTFALAYVAIQLGRTLFMAWAMRGLPGSNAINMMRISSWFAVSAVPWIAGGLAEPGPWRIGLWALALAIEYLGPIAHFRVPFLGRSNPGEWDISGSHMAERCALFIIIALGEGIVVTGATMSDRAFDMATTGAFLVAFGSSVMMWWLYFDIGAQRGSEHIGNHQEPGRVARNAYTYLHIPIVIGIIGVAVADEILLAHARDAAHMPLIAFLCGGMAIYLVGLGLFKRSTSIAQNFPLSHSAGFVLLTGSSIWAALTHPPALLLGAVVIAVQVVIAAWEWGSFHGGWVERWQRRRAA